jgi:glycosyltransferase involved in cell wall biosynthesis/GT2 family glycosyltransferase
MQSHVVSVVVCTYNRCNYLKGCLSSLKEQTCSPFEIIVVNGPSTDGTAEMLSAHPDIAVIRQRSLDGISRARNLGISAARGAIIAFIDDDAEADPRWLECLAENYADDAVGCAGGLVLGPDGRPQFDNGTIVPWGIPRIHREDGRRLEKHEYQICMGTNMSFRRDVLFRLDGFDPYFRYYHDESDLCVRAARAGYKVRYDRRAVVKHNMAEGVNRKSPYDMNWSDIVNNVVYFTVKNFRGDVRAFSSWPLRAILWWLRYFLTCTSRGLISRGRLISISGQVFQGGIRGYLAGLKRPRRGKNLVVMPRAGDGCLKICFLSKEYAKDCHGGICRYTYDLAHGLAAAGNEVHVITLSDGKEDYELADGDVIVHRVVPRPAGGVGLPSSMPVSRANLAYSNAACQKLLELIDERGIQIAEAPLWDAEGFVFSVAKKIPLVVRLETPLFKVADIQGWEITRDLEMADWMEGETVRNADLAIAISENIGEIVSRRHGVPAERLAVSPLGIEIPELRPPSGHPDRGSKILFAGRIEKRKGVDALFQSIPAVVAAVPDAVFIIAGSDTNLAPGGGSYQKYLLDRLDRKFHRHVRFVGYLDGARLTEAYRQCDVFVAPSLYESFGLVYLEAMAWGKPVIGCHVGGVPEVVEDGKSGLLVPPGDHAALAAATIRILTDEALRTDMGADARRRVESRYSSRVMTDNTLRIYMGILSRSGNGDNGNGRRSK